MKVRVEVLNKNELDTFLECLKLKYEILSVSKMYANRNSSYSRVYIDVKQKEKAKENRKKAGVK